MEKNPLKKISKPLQVDGDEEESLEIDKDSDEYRELFKGYEN